MDVLAAALPILVVLVAMVAVRWTAARAGLVGLAITLVLAVTTFGLGTDVLPDVGVAGAVGGALLEAVFTAVVILWIVVPALAIHNLQLRTGGTEVLRGALARLSRDPRVTALLVAWTFALFMEGAAGFGASVALAAPFLVSAGFSRVAAVTAALIGHSVGVSFGAVGTPVLPQITATGLSGLELSRAAGTYHALLGWLPLLVVVWLVTRMATAEGWEGLAPRRTVAMLTAVAAAGFLLPYAGLALAVGPELPTLGGALVGGGLLIAVLVVGRRRGLVPVPTAAPAGAPAPGTPAGSLARPVDDVAAPTSGRARALGGAPYLVLVGVVLVTRLVAPLQHALRSGW
ncbi:L-lactate permease, partial [Euzebya sp.]|uniref:L-lactate permease n=1 Tax=Euzebya sp. TaxID=1971409 RepID=UPI0035121A08